MEYAETQVGMLEKASDLDFMTMDTNPSIHYRLLFGMQNESMTEDGDFSFNTKRGQGHFQDKLSSNSLLTAPAVMLKMPFHVQRITE